MVAMSNFKFIANAKIDKLGINTSISFHQNKVVSEASFPNLLTGYTKSAVKHSLTLRHVSKTFYFLFSGQ